MSSADQLHAGSIREFDSALISALLTSVNLYLENVIPRNARSSRTSSISANDELEVACIFIISYQLIIILFNNYLRIIYYYYILFSMC